MVTLKIEPGSDGKVWVSLTHFSSEELARLKQIPGRRWNPERKQWSLPDNDETRIAANEKTAPTADCFELRKWRACSK